MARLICTPRLAFSDAALAEAAAGPITLGLPLRRPMSRRRISPSPSESVPSPDAAPGASRLHLYGVVSEPLRVPCFGIDGEPVRVVVCSGALAAVGRVCRPPLLDEPTLLAHDEALRRLGAVVGALLPARFGAGFPYAAALARHLATRAGALRAALALVAHREQMTLLLHGDGAPTLDEVADLAPRPRVAAHRHELPRLAAIRAAVARLAKAERLERADGAAGVAAPPTCLGFVHHLIERGQAGRYRAAIAEAAVDAPVRVTATGPGPAYAFSPDEWISSPSG